MTIVDYHGTLSGYQHYKCRCDSCRQAIRNYNAMRSIRNAALIKHGTYNAYNQYGCRCFKCRLAAHNRYRAIKLAKRAQQA